MIKNTMQKAQIPKRAFTYPYAKVSLINLALGLCVFMGMSTTQAADCPNLGSCSAKDVKLGLTTVSAPATCVQGEMVTVSITANLISTAAERYDGSLFLVTDEPNNQCLQGVVPADSADPDNCGTLPQGVERPVSLTTQVLCDGNINAALEIPVVAVWSQQEDGAKCDIGTGAKCNDGLAIKTDIIVITPVPALTVTKLANPLLYTAAGQTITYSYTVTNSGNTVIDNVALTDNKLPGADLSDCAATTLDPGDSTTCTAPYAITATDFATGSVTNVATAAGTYNNAPVSSNDTETVNAAKLTLDKSASPSIYQAAGTSITYNFLVTNTGLVDLTSVAIIDPTLTNLGVSITCPATTLAAGANMNCAATYLTTAADFAALKTLTNTATAGGAVGDVPVLSNQDSATVIAQAPAEPVQNSMTITKSASTSSYSAAGVTITYTFTVKNTGDGTINNIQVTDNILGAISGCATTLATGASTTCTKTYTTTQADLDADKTLVNSATVKGTPAEGVLPDPQPSEVVSVDAVQATALSIDKQATTLNYDAVGDVINYTYTVTNNGNITLNNLVVSDNKIAAIACNPTVLAPAAVATCTGSYTVTQEDIDAGSVVNLATAKAKTQQNTDVNAPQAQETVPAEQRKSLSLDKTSDPKAYTKVGDVIKYEFIVTNTGNTKIVGPFTISDPTIPAVTCPSTPTSLAPGETLTCTASYSISQADIDKGQVSNTAKASGGGINSNEDTHVISTQKQPGLAVKKTFTKFEDAATDVGTENAGAITAGDKLFYDIVVTNSGNVTLTNPILVNDPLTGLKDKQCAASLIPQATCTVSVTYIVTKADATNGSVTNTAIATSGESKAEGSATVFIVSPAPVEKKPHITLTKSTTGYDDIDKSESVTLNDKIHYKVVVTNTGEVDLTELVISDPVLTITSNTCLSTLKIGLSCTVEGFHIVNANDVSKSKVENTAVAQAKELTGQASSNTVVVGIGVAIPVFGPLGLIITLLGLYAFGRRRKLSQFQLTTYPTSPTCQGWIFRSN